MSEWVAVVQDEGDEPLEIPTESDGTILLTSLKAQFPGSTGLKFRNPDTNGLRGVRCLENQLFPPYENGWRNLTYFCVFPKSGDSSQDAALKRKSENDVEGMSPKNQRVEDMDETCSSNVEERDRGNDLIVLGLPWKTTEKDIRDYFASFGELSMVQLKTKVGTNLSKGFAFIRFKDPDVQNSVLLTRHHIQSRWCDVKIPDSQEIKSSKLANLCKIFVGRITETITPRDLKEHFETFGTVTDIYIPKPFRAFAFVSFSETRVAQSLLGKDHLIKGVSVHIGSAHSKDGGRNGSFNGRFDSYAYQERSTLNPWLGTSQSYNRAHPKNYVNYNYN